MSATALLLPVPTPTLYPFLKSQACSTGTLAAHLVWGCSWANKRASLPTDSAQGTHAHSTFYFLPPFLFEYKSILKIILDQTFLNLTYIYRKNIKIYDIKLVSLDVL